MLFEPPLGGGLA